MPVDGSLPSFRNRSLLLGVDDPFQAVDDRRREGKKLFEPRFGFITGHRLDLKAQPLCLGEHFGMSTSFAAYYSTAFDWVGFLGVLVAGYWSDRIPGSRRAPVIFWMTCGCLVATTAMWMVGLSSPVLFVLLLGLIGFMAMGPDSLLSGAGAMDVGSRRQAAVAAGVINGLGSIGPILQEPAIGWLKQTRGLESVFLLLVAIVFLTTIATGLLARFGRRQGV